MPLNLHVTTTPSVAYVARVDEFDCGIMISASHNPYYDNGIKLINGNGEKMDEDTISLVEAYLDGNLNTRRTMFSSPCLAIVKGTIIISLLNFAYTKFF